MNRKKINYNDIFLKKFDKKKNKNKFITKKEIQEIKEKVYEEEINLNDKELFSNLRSNIHYEKYKEEKFDIIEEMILQKNPVININDLLNESNLSNLLDTYSTTNTESKKSTKDQSKLINMIF